MFAGILRANVAMDRKLSGYDIQLFGDVFADFDQVLAAFPAGADFRFMAVFDRGKCAGKG